MAGILNNYFGSVFNCSVYDFPQLSTTINVPIKITKEGVVNLTRELKKGKAPGPDGTEK